MSAFFCPDFYGLAPIRRETVANHDGIRRMKSYELQHRDLVIIGSGMAAIRLVETLRRRGDRRSIAVLGAERSLPYNRIMLSPLLSGETAWQHLVSHPAEWYEQNAIDLHLGCAVSAIDCALQRVHCVGGFSLQYTDLVFATGSRAALPPLPGIELPGVSAFRDVDDVTRLQKAARAGRCRGRARRRAAGAGGGGGAGRARHARDAGASRGAIDESPARCDCRKLFAKRD